MLPKKLPRLNLLTWLKRTNLRSLKLRIEAWIRREIVDDDPWDAEMLLPESNQPDGLEADRSNPPNPPEIHLPEHFRDAQAQSPTMKNSEAKLTARRNRSN